MSPSVRFHTLGVPAVLKPQSWQPLEIDYAAMSSVHQRCGAAWREPRYRLLHQSCMNMGVAAATRLNMTYHAVI
jgi:hypothetical protein